MWAGGSFEWPLMPSDSQEPQGILVGSSISEETSVDKIEAKAGMVFVHQLKEYKSMRGGRTLVKEVRMHVFRPSLEASAADVKPLPNPTSEFHELLNHSRLIRRRKTGVPPSRTVRHFLHLHPYPPPPLPLLRLDIQRPSNPLRCRLGPGPRRTRLKSSRRSGRPWTTERLALRGDGRTVHAEFQ